MRKLFKNKKIMAFFLSLALGAIICIPNIIGGHGIYGLVADFNAQQIPFNKMMNYSIKEGSILWTWFNELGSNFIGAFSFYNLFSPFNIIGYIFPANWYEYLIGPIFILKYAVAGLTSYLFISRYVKNKNYALVGSLLYSFSGFQLTNTLFYHFHDVVAFFPLLLYTLDRLVIDKKKGWFALIVFLCAITNWFFFIGEVVFVIIYFIIRIITKSYEIKFKDFINVAVEGLLGSLIASFVLVPSLLFTISNPRINSTWNLHSMTHYSYGSMYLEILRAFLFPPELMYVRSFITNMNYTSVELYVPLFGIILVVPYMLKNKKKWPTILLTTCLLFMIIPIFNSSFFAFKNNYYARWFYMPILIISLISSICLDKKYKISSGLIFTIFSYFMFSLGVLFLTKYSSVGNNIIFDTGYFILTIIFSLFNLFIAILISLIKREKSRIILYIIFIFFFVGIWGNYMVYKYKNSSFGIDKTYSIFLHSSESLDAYSYSRSNSDDSCLFNIGYITSTNNIKSFNSNINSSNFEFYKNIGINREVSTIISTKDKYLNDYLGVKYVISCGNTDIEKYGYTFYKRTGNYNIYLNRDAKKIGFLVNEYIDKGQFNELEYNDKIEALNNKIVLNDIQIKKYKNLYFQKEKLEYDSDYKFLKNGFVSTINSNKETLAIYTIPYDEGWSATINGKKVKIENVDNGMMAIKINRGNNKIKFKYFTPGLKEGIIISVISSMLLILYLIFCNSKKGVRNEKR